MVVVLVVVAIVAVAVVVAVASVQLSCLSRFFFNNARRLCLLNDAVLYEDDLLQVRCCPMNYRGLGDQGPKTAENP